MKDHSISLLRATAVTALYLALGAVPAYADASRTINVNAPENGQKPTMKTAAPRKANGSGIEVRFRLDRTARVGEALPVSLGFVGVVPEGGASVRFEADAGLTLPAAYRQASVLTGNEPMPFCTVFVTPDAEGLFYLHAFTTQHGVTSVSSMAVQVGLPAAAKPQVDLQATPEGGLLRTMPVR
jgi:hypothetical protein